MILILVEKIAQNQMNSAHMEEWLMFAYRSTNIAV